MVKMQTTLLFKEITKFTFKTYVFFNKQIVILSEEKIKETPGLTSNVS